MVKYEEVGINDVFPYSQKLGAVNTHLMLFLLSTSCTCENARTMTKRRGLAERTLFICDLIGAQKTGRTKALTLVGVWCVGPCGCVGSYVRLGRPAIADAVVQQ